MARRSKTPMPRMRKISTRRSVSLLRRSVSLLRSSGSDERMCGGGPARYLLEQETPCIAVACSIILQDVMVNARDMQVLPYRYFCMPLKVLTVNIRACCICNEQVGSSEG